nr:zinc knuckle CX2CX4HX4C [Tanacetum cinerariifolium]
MAVAEKYGVWLSKRVAVNEGNDNANSSNEGVKEVNEKGEEVVKKVNVDIQKDGTSDINTVFNTAVTKLVDIVNSSRLDNKMVNVPTKVSESGNDVVIFNDELVELGSKKWNLKVCRQFIRCSMGFNEAMHHIRRMWNKLGLRDVIAENGVCYFKFHDEEGIKEVINNGPWMVNNKPIMVQKWSIDMCLDKAEPKKIHVWVKMMNVLIEAWSVNGISALASNIGKPVIMDEVTTKMCATGAGRISFARVLVEIDAEKEIKDKTEIMYKSKNSYCKFKSKNAIDIGIVKANANEIKVMQNRKYGREGFNMNMRTNMHNGQNGREDEGKRKDVNVSKGRDIEASVMNTNNEKASGGKMKKRDNKKMHREGSTSVENSNGKGMLGSNRFTLLDSLVNEEELVPNTDQMEIMHKFLSKKNDANNMEMNGWSEDMKRHYMDKKELFDAAQEIRKNKDVLDDNYGVENVVLRNEMHGVGRNILT